MKRMDHPNIVRLFETFEDHKNIYLILELCTGGELFDAIVSSGFLNEKEASKLIRQILSAIFYMHTNGIMHRDLKPENFLFATKEKGSTLKVGCIQRFELSENFLFRPQGKGLEIKGRMHTAI